MSSLFEAYITNLGKYNEGRLVGETLKFPATTEEVQALLKRIGVDGVRYEEIFITSFDGDVLGLYDHLGEYPHLRGKLLNFNLGTSLRSLMSRGIMIMVEDTMYLENFIFPAY